MADTLVELRQVSVGYGRKPLGQNLSLCLNRGDYMGLVGPNGTGKTTLLRCLNFLETADGGSISVDGKPVFDAADPSLLSPKDLVRFFTSNNAMCLSPVS